MSFQPVRAGLSFRGQVFVFFTAVVLLIPLSVRAQELIQNGTFDHADGDLAGWLTDYEWSGNKYYVDNKSRVSVVPEESGKTKVVKIVPAGDPGAKMECIPIPLEPGYKYSATLEVKGGPYRIYFAGYKWQPGIRPHESPELGELRMIYKSKASSGSAASWKKEELSLPGVKLSAGAIKNLKYVRFVTLYVWFMKPGYVDNIVVTKTEDPSMKF